ncbi:MAG: peptidoglycan-binding protein [Gemmatimonadota bacterium]
MPRLPAAFIPAILSMTAAFPPAPRDARAQDAVRVVEVVSQTTGDRRRWVVSDLDEREIRLVQRLLRGAGYAGIGWTGRLDDGTRDGLRRFQAARGLVECGCISYETIVALGIRPEVVASVAEPPRDAAPGTVGAVGGWGWIYPVAIPIIVPRPCPGGDCGDQGPPARPGVSPAPSEPPGGAVPPGVRPAPPTEPRALPPSPRRRD